jgi:hypothetical protein
MSFEDHLIRNLDRRNRTRPHTDGERISHDPIEVAHKRALELLRNKEYSIQTEDFIDLYGQHTVLTDRLRVRELKAKFDQTPTTKAAHVLEALMIEQSELSNWLGDSVTVLKSTEYDDYINGVDMIAEWMEGGQESQVLALAVDVTSGTDAIRKKMERIRREIDSGSLGTIKYFATSDGTFRGQRLLVPRVVIGASHETIKDAARLWNANEKKSLGNHTIQHSVLSQVDQQLSLMQRYAEARGSIAAAHACDRDRAIVERIRASKQRMAVTLDPVAAEVIDTAREMFRT